MSIWANPFHILREFNLVRKKKLLVRIPKKKAPTMKITFFFQSLKWARCETIQLVMFWAKRKKKGFSAIVTYMRAKSETELTASVLKKDPKHTRD